MSVGKKILRLRMQAKLTQREVSEASGLAPSYLSRLENGRITPTVRTVTRIAEALDVPITEFFDHETVLEPGDRCPVSVSGRCILDHLHITRGRPLARESEGYSSEQLEILRQCNFLLQCGDQEVQDTLAHVVRALLAQNATMRGSAAPKRSRKPKVRPTDGGPE